MYKRDLLTRRQLAGAALFGAAAARLAQGQDAQAAGSRPRPLDIPRARAGSPNIVYIIMDDTGFSDFHCFGSEVSTPNVDALAAGGLLYNNFHTNAICSPSRASLLTGRNSHAVGMKELAGDDQGYPHSRGRVTPAAATVAQILRANGYGTMGVGKWHLVPASDTKASGARTHWPIQKGFDRYYGFFGGQTDQYHPTLYEDNHAIPRPKRPDYHFSVDIVDQAIQMMSDHVTADPKKPFFLHLAFGATHQPYQVPKRYIDKYVAIFEKGWDQVREDRYRRQLALGIIPPGTKLPPRNPGDPAWNDLGPEERAVFARFMATYSGFLEQADEQIGRVVRYLKENNLFDNTLIFLLSDNGGAPEAGLKGGFARAWYDPMTIHEMYERREELGSEKTKPLYQRPWAMVSDTPFRYYKLWPYRGGGQTPLVVSWPAGIRGRGVRKQYVHAIDITPTVLELAGLAAPPVFEGVPQIPLHGKSIRATFDNPESPNPRDTQYFELWGSRGIWHRGWSAIGIHKPGTDFDTDRWELYNVEADFSESENLAARHPEKLAEMKKLWWSEAAKNGALPLLEAAKSRQSTYDQALEP